MRFNDNNNNRSFQRELIYLDSNYLADVHHEVVMQCTGHVVVLTTILMPTNDHLWLLCVLIDVMQRRRKIFFLIFLFTLVFLSFCAACLPACLPPPHLNSRINVGHKLTRGEEQKVAWLGWDEIVAVCKLVADVLALQKVDLRLVMGHASCACDLVQVKEVRVNFTGKLSI